jgi:carbon-monoxide dehydrogenase catalytic subunit
MARDIVSEYREQKEKEKKLRVEKTSDPATAQMIEKSKGKCRFVFDRAEVQYKAQCEFGILGVCCVLCNMGPCRVNTSSSIMRSPALEDRGVCGADVDTIVARNFVRMLANGASSHTEHARHILQAFSETIEGNGMHFKISDEKKLHAVMQKLKVKDAKGVAKAAENDLFGGRKRSKFFKSYIDKRTARKLKRLMLFPRGPYFEVGNTMHRITMGVDSDPLNLLVEGLRLGMADGNSMLVATELQDILFGTPSPKESEINLGVLKEDEVNIITHGHVPLIAEKLVQFAKDPEFLSQAKAAGAKGINVVGMCCTGNEMMMRHGMHVAGNVIQQEFAIATGAVDASVLDVQCIYPSIKVAADCYGTKLFNTMSEGRIAGVEYLNFFSDPDGAIKKVITAAITNFRNRKEQKKEIFIPKEKSRMVSGFSVEAITEKGAVAPLLDAIKSGKVRGVVAIVGCSSPKVRHNYSHVSLARELIKKDVLVVSTGCAAKAIGEAGLTLPEAASQAGTGLQEVCKSLGIPPVLHMGSCVDNSRIAVLLSAVADALGVDISDLPVAASAPEWYSQKAASIAAFAVGLGVTTFSGTVPQIYGSETVVKILTEDVEKMTGGKFVVEVDPFEQAAKIMTVIESKRKKLKI